MGDTQAYLQRTAWPVLLGCDTIAIRWAVPDIFKALHLFEMSGPTQNTLKQWHISEHIKTVTHLRTHWNSDTSQNILKQWHISEHIETATHLRTHWNSDTSQNTLKQWHISEHMHTQHCCENYKLNSNLMLSLSLNLPSLHQTLRAYGPPPAVSNRYTTWQFI